MSTRWIRVALVIALMSLAALACKPENQATPVPPTDAGPVAPAQDAGPTAADASTKAPVPEPTGPIARVNGVELPRDKYKAEVDQLQKRFAMFGGNMPEAQLAKFKQRIVDRMVEDELIKQKLDADKVVVPEADIAKELEDYKARTPGGPEQFEDFLKKSGKTVEDLKLDITKRLALKTYLNKDGALNITPEEATKYFEENKKRFTTQERIKASHILVKIDAGADQPTKDAAKKRIDDFYKEATVKGADFAAIAKKSDGPSAPRGGDLGWFTRGRMVKEFEDIAFPMKVGEISKPFETKFGWHVVQVLEKEAAGEKKFEEVKDDINQRLEARKLREAREKFLADLKTNGKVEILEKIEIPPASPTSAPGGLTPITPNGLNIKTPEGLQVIPITPNQGDKPVENTPIENKPVENPVVPK